MAFSSECSDFEPWLNLYLVEFFNETTHLFRSKREIRHLEAEVQKWQVLVDTVSCNVVNKLMSSTNLVSLILLSVVVKFGIKLALMLFLVGGCL